MTENDDSGPSMVHKNCLVEDPVDDEGMVAVVPVEELQSLADKFEDKSKIKWGQDAQSALQYTVDELQSMVDGYE